MIDPKELGKKKFIVEAPDHRSFRDANVSEIVEAVAAGARKEALQQIVYLLQSNIDDIEKDCPHTVTYDEDGMPYTIRTCVACGHTELI